MVNPFDLQGKNAVVTGANTGLGQAMAVALARAGARIALVGRSTPDDTQAIRSIYHAALHYEGYDPCQGEAPQQQS